jgi:transposase
MNTNLASQASDWREGRRLRGWELHQQGWTQQQIAEALGVTQGTVCKWLSRAQTLGLDALRRKKAAGPIPRLSAEQRAQLPALLSQGAEAFGFRGAVWTRARIAAVIKRTFGVVYHPAHISRILKAIRWSRQQPIRRARQRNEPAIHHWREQDAPALKKKS